MSAVVWQMTQTMFSEKADRCRRDESHERSRVVVRQRANDQGSAPVFQPSVNVQRQGATAKDLGDRPDHHAGRRAALRRRHHRRAAQYRHTASRPTCCSPANRRTRRALKQALANANAMQDFAMEEIRPGRTGNEFSARCCRG
jgi:hypothetical protein